MSVDYAVDGIADTDARALTLASLFSPGVTVRRQSLTLPGRHGATPTGPVVFDEPTLALEWELTAPSWSDLEEERARLMLLLARPGDLQVTRTIAPTGRTARARLVSIGESVAETASPLLRIPVVLALPEAFFRSEPVTTPSVPVPHAGAVLTGLACTAPIVDAVARVRGPATWVELTDPVSGTGLSWTGTLLNTQYLYLDAASLTTRRSTSGSAWESGGTDVSSGLDYPGAGPLQLWPEMHLDPATRRVRLAASGTGTAGTTEVAVRARPAFL